MSFAQYLGVPAYFYPGTSDYWERLIAAGTRHVVINPASGPGGAEDPLYTAQIAACQAAGIYCYGYVATTYGAKAAATLNGEVDDWYDFYPDINGIFFDEVSSDEADIVYYQTARAYVISVADPGYGKVVLNPGTIPDEIYMSNADIVVTFEDTYANYLTYTAPSWAQTYPPERTWHMVHTCTLANMPNAITLSKNRGAGVVFVTDDIMANPYDTMPPAAYYTAEAAAVAVVTTPTEPVEDGEEAVEDNGTMPTAFSHNSHRYGDKHKLIEFNRNGEVPLLFTALPPFVNQHWIPAIDNYYDQGSLSKRWRDIHIGRNASIAQNLDVYGYADVRGLLTGRTGIKVASSILPYSGTPNVGGNGVGERMGTGYFGALDVTNNTASGTLGVTGLSTLTGGLRTGAAIQTSGNGVHDIGSNANPFKDLYITGDVYKNGVALGGASAGYQNIFPEIDNTYDIGSLTKRWKNLVVAGQSLFSQILPFSNDTGIIGGGSFRFNNSWITQMNTTALLTADPNGTTGAGNIGTSLSWWYEAYIRRIFGYDINASNELSGRYINALESLSAPSATITNLTVTGTLTHNGITSGGGGAGTYPTDIVARTVLPVSANTGNIGASNRKYATGYFQFVSTDSIIGTSILGTTLTAQTGTFGTLNVPSGVSTVKDLVVTGSISGAGIGAQAYPLIFYWAKPFAPIEDRNWFMGDYYQRFRYETSFWNEVLNVALALSTSASAGAAVGVSAASVPIGSLAAGVLSAGAVIAGQIVVTGVTASVGVGQGFVSGTTEGFYTTIPRVQNDFVSRYKRAKDGYVMRSTKLIQQNADSLHCAFSYAIRVSSFVEGGNIPDTTQFYITHLEMFADMSNPIRFPTGVSLEAAAAGNNIPIGVASGTQIKNVSANQYARRHLQGNVKLLKTEAVSASDGRVFTMIAVEMMWQIDSESKPSFNDDFELQANFIIPLKTLARCTFMMVPAEAQMPVGNNLLWDPYYSNRV